MKKAILFLLFANFITIKNIQACSCLTPTSFCESITNSNGDVFAEFIVRATVSENENGLKKILIKELIHGDLNKDEVTIHVGFCTLYYSGLESGKEYVIAFSETQGFYNLVNCAISYLEIENGIVKGQIAPGVESMNYVELNSIEGCGDFKTIFRMKDLLLFPNPTLGEIQISTGNSDISIENIHFEIFDITGRKLTNVRRMDGILEEEVLKMNLENLAGGVYIIRFSNSFEEYSHRVVKQ